MLPLKDLRGLDVGEKVTGWGLKILKELEGLPGGRAWFTGHAPFRQGRIYDPDKIGIYNRQGYGEQAEDRADYSKDYSILVPLVKD